MSFWQSDACHRWFPNSFISKYSLCADECQIIFLVHCMTVLRVTPKVRFIKKLWHLDYRGIAGNISLNCSAASHLLDELVFEDLSRYVGYIQSTGWYAMCRRGRPRERYDIAWDATPPNFCAWYIRSFWGLSKVFWYMTKMNCQKHGCKALNFRNFSMGTHSIQRHALWGPQWLIWGALTSALRFFSSTVALSVQQMEWNCKQLYPLVPP